MNDSNSNSVTYGAELSSFMEIMRNELENKIAFQLPLTIGQYRLEQLVGRGGMGDVYRAENLVLKRTEALKFVRAKLSAKPEAIKRFREEIESTAKLLHPNVVTVFNAGEFEGRPYMVMEFLDGWTVHEYVQQRLKIAAPLSVQEAVDIIVQAARGLQYAHENGFIHRDVKPGNLWITPNKTVKVLDLGLALAASASASAQIVGTPDFMSPEQSAVGREPQADPDSTSASAPDPRSDVYSLGCTLFYILTGQVPFGGEEYSTSEKKMEAQRTCSLPPLSQFRKDVPEYVQKALNRMTEKSVDARFASMSDVIAALQAPTKKTPVSAVAVAAVLLGLLGVWWTINSGKTTPPPAIVQEEQTPQAAQDVNVPPPAAPEEPAKSEPAPVEPTQPEESPTEPAQSEPVPSEPAQSEPTQPEVASTGAFPVGSEAGEKLVRVVDGVEYAFRWCPPGEFVMGSHGVPVSKEMSIEQMLDVIKSISPVGNMANERKEEDLLGFEDELKDIKKKYRGQNLESELERLHDKIYNYLLSPSSIIASQILNVEYDAPHRVTLTHGFWMLDCEVTRKMWFDVMPKSSANKQINLDKQSDDYPVRLVSWRDAQEFCQKLSKKMNADVQLPTEAQWEYACRADSDENMGQILDYANVAESFLRDFTPVRSLSPNAWGLYDMIGNVEEWCADWFAPYSGDEPQVDPAGPEASKPLKSVSVKEAKILRGSSKRYSVNSSNPYSGRNYQNINNRGFSSGFRICVPVK